MKIYIDEEFRCHCTAEPGTAEIETNIFNGKAKEYIEGFRFVPQGETWTRDDGEIFTGEMVAPFKPYAQLAMAQAAYEEAEEITQIITGEVSINDES